MDKWKAGEKKQIYQFTFQTMIGKLIDTVGLPKKQLFCNPISNMRQNNSMFDDLELFLMVKKAVPYLHAVASTWSLCVELPIQQLILSICAHTGLNIYDNNIVDAYAHSLTPNDT